MAKTLLIRPCVLSAAASSRARSLRQALPCSIQPNKGSISRSSALLLTSTAEEGRTKLPIHRKSEFEGGSLSRRRFASRATNVNEAGSIDSPLMHSMEKKIKEQLNAESVSVKDAYGDGRHVSIDVISSSFEGESAVNRQRMVYNAIWEELQNIVHAVDQMTTKTPAEAAMEK